MSESLTRGRLWGPADRSGGPLDDVLGGARRLLRGLTVERLRVTHPGDDDNVYFLSVGSARVQVDSGPHGQAPFIVEGLIRTDTPDPAEALAAVCREFGLHEDSRSVAV
ncbi:hypothetical protein [Embleya sp. AB8]|uniref:hypothetical protein n=1 Tax=Embleya sp. AB8 TaxID=3156304 RepID=UPI003C7180F4